MANTRDVLVAGGGIAGLAVALAVRRAAPMARVAVADPAFADPAFADPALASAGPTQGRRTLRAVAVAAGSRRFLDALGAWEPVAAAAQPMVEMVITDSREADAPRPVFLDFDGEAEPGEPFAHMVFQDDLRAAVLRAATENGVELVPDRVSGFRREGGAALAIEAGGTASRARLLVAADGGRSRLREAAGIATVGWDYPQSGIVATLSHEIPHDGRATQHFLPGGPLAILPMRAADGSERRFSLVWSVPHVEAARLLALAPADFIAALEARIGFAYGALTLEDRPAAYPLRLVLPRALVAERFALLGDAARTIHPLAGQGLNLGLRDAAALAEAVAEPLGLGLDPADPSVLDAYARARRFDAVLMAGATDGLNRLFSNDSLPARVLRDVGLGLVDRVPALKRLFIRDASGLSGAVPDRFRR
ncbi:FAD-dependent monooxygenase [Lichenibacterium ramalinae]|uniref:2-octaprenyl-6-methoxyphenyl hydroxylase n=1 Tax=Lichenibacterium ramalinae TaxID=2316527 RepID=A0A4Q2RH65_9HYPH|nr:FAD-dependent monooxygenase [Lichenibacterium ramalinae]RYB07828.1 2-octaprenyl-6-methoxyphenyl hydroxylase [Lichenibacterium ramalinae]